MLASVVCAFSLSPSAPSRHRGQKPPPDIAPAAASVGRLLQGVEPAKGAELAFAFSPGGLLFPYELGVAYELLEQGFITPKTPVGGSSAGAIVATAIATGLAEADVIACLVRLVRSVRWGTRLDVALRKELQLILDEGAPALARRHRLAICYLEVLPRPRSRTVTSWQSKEDLIDCVCASCNVPLYFSRRPLAPVRGSWALDGVMAVNPLRFGCPRLPAERVVACTALPPPAVNLLAFDAADVIQPSSAELGWWDRRKALPMSSLEWLLYGALPASDRRLHEMIALGKRHARVWLSTENTAGRRSGSTSTGLSS